jgi:hypothetical protein
MTTPGFSAAASVYSPRRSYHGRAGTFGVGLGEATIAPQQDPGCTVSCADWIMCNTKCGAWPPGFSNADCWINCLKPTIDCLQGSTCFAPPPSCDDQCAGLQGCNKVACLCRCEGGKLAPGGTKACSQFHCVDLP